MTKKFLFLSAMVLMLASCGNADNALEEIINGGSSGGSSEVTVTSLLLSNDALAMDINDADETLIATVDPADATVTWSSDKPAVATVTNGVVHAVAAGTAIITAKAGDKSATCTVSVNMPGLLTGVFSVSDTKKVRFSQGNLQATYDGSSWTWAFAANQYDYKGNDVANTSINGNGTISGTGTVDLFGWWTDAGHQYGISNSTDDGNYSGNFVDWGTLAISNGGNTADLDWRTLTGGSEGEWKYLLETRTASTVNGTPNARYAKATVAGKTGVIIFPDSYTHPSDVTLPGSINTDNANFTNNTYDATKWGKMEAAGCVFLPAAGDRTGANVTYFGTGGYYWSSTPYNAPMAYFLNFNETSMDFIITTSRHIGMSVRLVYDVK